MLEKKPVEADIIYEKSSGGTNDEDSDASAHSKVPEYQDT